MAQQKANLLKAYTKVATDTSAGELDQPGTPFTCALCTSSTIQQASSHLAQQSLSPVPRQQACGNDKRAWLCVMEVAALPSALVPTCRGGALPSRSTMCLGVYPARDNSVASLQTMLQDLCCRALADSQPSCTSPSPFKQDQLLPCRLQGTRCLASPQTAGESSPT